jgi:hypothetical protein
MGEFEIGVSAVAFSQLVSEVHESQQSLYESAGGKRVDVRKGKVVPVLN